MLKYLAYFLFATLFLHALPGHTNHRHVKLLKILEDWPSQMQAMI
jgi:hypothetical protein